MKTRGRRGPKDDDGFPALDPASVRLIIDAHRISVAEKETFELKIETESLEEKILVVQKDLIDLRNDKKRLSKKMKRQAEVFRRFLSHGVGDSWIPGETLNLGEGLRVVAAGTEARRADVEAEREKARERALRRKNEIEELEKEERKVEKKLEEAKKEARRLKRYRSAGAAEDADAISSLLRSLKDADADFVADADLARRVVGQSRRRIEKAAEEAKKREIEKAMEKMREKMERGEYRIESKEHRWLSRSLSVYRRAIEDLEAETGKMEEENLELVGKIIDGRREMDEEEEKSWPWDDDEDEDTLATGGTSVVYEATPCRSVSPAKSPTKSSSKSSKSDILKLLDRSPTLRHFALPLYESLSASQPVVSLPAIEGKVGGVSGVGGAGIEMGRGAGLGAGLGAGGVGLRSTSIWGHRISTPAHLRRDLDLASLVEEDADDSFIEDSLYEISEHLYADAEVSSKRRDRERRSKLQEGLMVVGISIDVDRPDDASAVVPPVNSTAEDSAAAIQAPSDSVLSLPNIDASSSIPKIKNESKSTIKFPSLSNAKRAGGLATCVEQWPIDEDLMRNRFAPKEYPLPKGDPV